MRKQKAGAEALRVRGLGKGRFSAGDGTGALRSVRQPGWAGVVRVEELMR